MAAKLTGTIVRFNIKKGTGSSPAKSPKSQKPAAAKPRKPVAAKNPRQRSTASDGNRQQSKNKAKPKAQTKAKAQAQATPPTPPPPPTSPDFPPLVNALISALDEKKAEQLLAVDVRGRSPVTDWLVIATATSEPHLRALRIAAEKAFDDANAPVVGSEAKTGSGWYVVDGFDVMTHIFLPEQRAAYRLEQLWAPPATSKSR